MSEMGLDALVSSASAQRKEDSGTCLEACAMLPDSPTIAANNVNNTVRLFMAQLSRNGVNECYGATYSNADVVSAR